jgi:hypothetical protein
MLTAVRHRLDARSRALLVSLENSSSRMVGGWVVLVAAACGVRMATSPIASAPAFATWIGYALVAAAPIGSMLAARRWFQDGERIGAGAHALDRHRYRVVPLEEARRHPRYGASGMMVSLLIGLLICIALRTFEYFAALPVLAADVPAWLATLHFVLTLDVVLFTSLYAVAFVAALRNVPIFPRLLALIWAADLAMQLGIAQAVAGQPDLPVAVGTALHRLLDGHVVKVLLSVAIWLPYLLLSTRVNVTYRHRLPRQSRAPFPLI